MKIQLLQAALRNYLTSDKCPEDQHDEVFAALDECKSSLERFTDEDLWKGEVALVNHFMLGNMLNQLTYDTYGKRARKQSGNVPFHCYAYDCRTLLDLQDLTDDQLHHGYDVITDLWSDNDALGDNNDDGTFKHKVE